MVKNNDHTARKIRMVKNIVKQNGVASEQELYSYSFTFNEAHGR